MKSLKIILLIFGLSAAVFSCTKRAEPLQSAANSANQTAVTQSPLAESQSEGSTSSPVAATTQSIRDIALLEFYIKPSCYLFENTERPGTLHDFSELYPLGFSADGKFACIKSQELDGVGFCSVSFFIQNLVTDEIVFSLSNQNESAEEYFEGNSHNSVQKFVQTHSTQIDSAILDSKINIQKHNFERLPFLEQGASISASAVVTPTGELLHEFVPLANYSVIAASSNGKQKTVAQKSDVPVYNVYICGYIKNPYENRIALVYAEEAFGFEGADLLYYIAGCDTVKGF